MAKFILVHQAYKDHKVVYVNPEKVVAVFQSNRNENGCVISLSNREEIEVMEYQTEVVDAIEEMLSNSK